MFMVFIQILFEMVMSCIGLLRIYFDWSFIAIAKQEKLDMYLVASLVSMGLIMIPKLYAWIMTLAIMFGGVKTENKLRKHSFRILIFNEFRMQALNVEYVQH